MKIWRTPEGEWIDRKEFVRRFKTGVRKVTPLQQARSQMLFSWITIVGLLCGLVVSIISYKNLWWLGIILLAGLGNTLVGLIGIYQRYAQLKQIEDMTKGVNDGL